MSASSITTDDKPEVAATSEHVKAPVVDDAPDPDEDDLDDLDDMLDEFSSARIDSKAAPATASSKPEAPAAQTTKGRTIPTLAGDVPAIDADDFSEEGFQQQLQAGMAELMGDFDKNVSVTRCSPNL